MRPPFRAEHVGTLLRNLELNLEREHEGAGINADELGAFDNGIFCEAIALQEVVGLQVAADGEFRPENCNVNTIRPAGPISLTAPARLAIRGCGEQEAVNGVYGQASTLVNTDPLSLSSECDFSSTPDGTISFEDQLHARTDCRDGSRRWCRP